MPTFTTSNARMCLLLSNGRFGLLRIEDAERLQVGTHPTDFESLKFQYAARLRPCGHSLSAS